MSHRDGDSICKYCSVYFKHEKNLTRHKKQFHPIEYQAEVEAAAASIQKNLVCEHCSKSFHNIQYLLRHISRTHHLGNVKNNPSCTCQICSKAFGTRRGLMRHRRTIHKNDIMLMAEAKQGKLKCPVDCESWFHSMRELHNHMEIEHRLSLQKEVLQFRNFEEFSEWLVEEEKKTISSYVLHHQKWKVKGNQKSTYYCHRSGYYVPTGAGKRRLKTQGSAKINAYCPSIVEVIEMADHVKVMYCKTHYGHSNQIGHLRLSARERREIAGKLAQGEEPQRILDDLRQPVVINCRKIQRQHLTSRKDLHNVRKSFGIPSKRMRARKIKARSVKEWVEEMETKGSSCPVLFYKNQGEEHEEIPVDDFVLVLMTPFQRSVFQKYAHDRICVDSTHGTTGHDIHLTTILVVDNYQEGFPVAFCISTQVDKTVVEVFFKQVRATTVTQLHTKVFTSDATNEYYNMWCSVMGVPEHRFLSTWHVYKAWQSNLNTIADETKRDNVYKCLTTCATELCVNTFCEMFSYLLDQLEVDSDTAEIYNYLYTNNALNTALWAFCYRTGLKTNTVVHLKNYDREIRQAYLDGVKSKHIDKCVGTLQYVLIDKVIDSVAKLEKIDVSTRIAEMKPRHLKGSEISSTCQKITSSSWCVPSQTKPEKSYTVDMLQHDCKADMCVILCPQCNSCTKMFSCQCEDYVVENNLCKHVHAVSIFEKQAQQSEPVCEVTEVICVDEKYKKIIANPLEIVVKKYADGLGLLRENKHKILSPDVVPDILRHLDAAIKLIRVGYESRKSTNSPPLSHPITNDGTLDHMYL